MFINHIHRIRSGFIVGAITWLMLALPCGVFAQSPLTVQPSTGRVGIGNTNPSEALDITGTVKATTFKGDGSQLTNLPIGGSADTADVQIFTTAGAHFWTKPLNAKQVFVYLVGGGGGGGSGQRSATGPYSTLDGGGGGGGGARSSSSWPGAVLHATEAVTVGGNGTGGAATGTDNTVGNTGTDGGSTTFGSWLKAGGGDGSWSSLGGPSGGGMENGGDGGPNAWSPDGRNGSGLAAGGGGAGGGFSGSAAAAGANGGNYGGGGGAGGASPNGQLSGKGGDGAPGIAIIVSIF